MKPLLAKAVKELEDVTILNRINITDYIVEENEIKGAFGFSIEEGTAYEIRAKKVLCATGGAAGLYRPNNPGFPTTKCGIRHLIPEPVMRWEFAPERK